DGHDRSVNSVSRSPDGRIASGSDDTTVRIWQADGTLLHTLDDHAERVTSVAFSPRGMQLATADASGAVYVWDPESGERVSALGDRSTWITRVAFSPDGRTLAVATRDRSLTLWNLDTRQPTLNLTDFDGWVTDIQFAPDGNAIAAATDSGTVEVRSLQDGIPLQTAPTGYPDGVARIRFDASGETLAIAGTDGAIALWNWQTDRERMEIVAERRDGARILALDFTPDGRKLVTGQADGMVRIWSLEGDLLAMLRGHDDAVFELDIAADGTLVSASRDRTVRLWEIPDLNVNFTTEGAFHAEFVPSPEETQLVSSEWDGSVKLWRLTGDRPELIRHLRTSSSQPVVHFSISPNGDQLATVDASGTIALANLDSTGGLRALSTPNADASRVAFSPDGSLLATGSEDGTVNLWQAETRNLERSLSQAADAITAIAFTPDGNHLAASSRDRHVYIWEISSGELITKLPVDAAAIAFSPNGRHLAIGAWNDEISLWDWRAERQILALLGHTDSIADLQFSPDGATLLSGSRDRTLRLWNVRDGSLLTTFAGHRGGVRSARFSPDGSAIASTSEIDGLRTRSLDLNTLMAASCRAFGAFLRTNPHVAESDRHLCDPEL
ncbi:MAG: WD40 repeat domain-containing protein, partial [Cyanobacteria bacterium J06639_1]